VERKKILTQSQSLFPASRARYTVHPRLTPWIRHFLALHTCCRHVKTILLA